MLPEQLLLSSSLRDQVAASWLAISLTEELGHEAHPQRSRGVLQSSTGLGRSQQVRRDCANVRGADRSVHYVD